MATAMTCSQCWTTVPAGKAVCPRCGSKVTGAPPSVAGLLKSYPWLGVIMALSVLATIWAAARRPAPPPPPEVIPAVVEPVAAPAPRPEPEVPFEFPPMPAPRPAPVEAAPAPVQMQRTSEDPPPPAPSAETHQNPDGTWSSGPAPAR